MRDRILWNTNLMSHRVTPVCRSQEKLRPLLRKRRHETEPTSLYLRNLHDVRGFGWNGSRRQIEGCLRIWFRWVKVGYVFGEELAKRELGFADAVDHAPRQFIGSIFVEMGIVADGLGLVREGVGRVVHECLHRTIWTHGFKENLAHYVEVDECRVLCGSNLAHRIGIACERVCDLAVVVKGPAVHAGDQHRYRTFGAGLRNVDGK